MIDTYPSNFKRTQVTQGQVLMADMTKVMAVRIKTQLQLQQQVQVQRQPQMKLLCAVSSRSEQGTFPAAGVSMLSVVTDLWIIPFVVTVLWITHSHDETLTDPAAPGASFLLGVHIQQARLSAFPVTRAQNYAVRRHLIVSLVHALHFKFVCIVRMHQDHADCIVGTHQNEGHSLCNCRANSS